MDNKKKATAVTQSFYHNVVLVCIFALDTGTFHGYSATSLPHKIIAQLIKKEAEKNSLTFVHLNKIIKKQPHICPLHLFFGYTKSVHFLHVPRK